MNASIRFSDQSVHRTLNCLFIATRSLCSVVNDSTFVVIWESIGHSMTPTVFQCAVDSSRKRSEILSIVSDVSSWCYVPEQFRFRDALHCKLVINSYFIFLGFDSKFYYYSNFFVSHWYFEPIFCSNTKQRTWQVKQFKRSYQKKNDWNMTVNKMTRSDFIINELKVHLFWRR